MKKYYKRAVLLISDILLINMSFFFAWFIWVEGETTGMRIEDPLGLILLCVAASAVKVAFFMLFRLYHSLWRYAGVYELFRIVIASMISNFTMYIYALIVPSAVSRGIFVFTMFVDIAFIGGSRLAYRVIRRFSGGEMAFFAKYSEDKKRVLVYGGGDAGATLIRELLKNPSSGMKPVGIIDDDLEKHTNEINGVPVLGGRDAIKEVVKEKDIDLIIVAIPSADSAAKREVMDICLETGCKVKTLPSITQLIDGTVSVKNIRDVNLEDLLMRDPVEMDKVAVADYIKDKTVLVTGGGGSIGSELCRQIAGFSPKLLVILDNYENGAFDIQNELAESCPGLKLHVVIASIRDKKRLENIFEVYKPDVVFHAAAHKHVHLMESNPGEAVKNNIFGTLNVVECAGAHEAKEFILISTDKAVNPTGVMGATKRIAEMIIQSMNGDCMTKFAAVRFGNVLGSNGSVVPLFMKQIERGGPVTVTHPDITRYFMTIPEAAQLVIQAGTMVSGGEVFLLEMGTPVKIVDLARRLISLAGFEPDKDIKIRFTELRPGEKLHEELLMAEEGIIKTVNEKISVANLNNINRQKLKQDLEKLNNAVENGDESLTEYILDLAKGKSTDI